MLIVAWASTIVRAATPQVGIYVPLVADTEDATCEVLKKTVVSQRHLPDDTPTQYKWFCDFSVTQNEYMRIVALRAGRCEAYASCLMGWFAVMRRSTVVLQWDVGNDRIVPLDKY